MSDSKLKKQKNNHLRAPEKLKLLVTIVNRSKVDFYLDILNGFEVNMQLVIYGKGTAPKEFLLSIGQSDKAVIFSFIKASQIKKAMETLQDKFNKIRNGKGIAYSLPISSMIGVYLYQFLSNNGNNLKKEVN